MFVPSLFAEIQAEGSASKTLAADVADLLLPARGFGKTKEEASEALAEMRGELETVLRTVKLEGDIQRSQVRWFKGDDKQSMGIVRADQTLKVVLSEPDAFSGLARELATTGIEVPFPVYRIKDRNKLEKDLQLAAIKQAQESAGVIARTLDIPLGSFTGFHTVFEIEQSQFGYQAVDNHSVIDVVQGEVLQIPEIFPLSTGARVTVNQAKPTFELDVPRAAFAQPILVEAMSVSVTFGEPVKRMLEIPASATTNVAPDRIELVFNVRARGRSPERAAEALKNEVTELQARLEQETLEEDSLRFSPMNISEDSYNAEDAGDGWVSITGKEKGGGGRRLASFNAQMDVSCALLDLGSLPKLRTEMSDVDTVTVKKAALSRTDAEEIQRALVERAFLEALSLKRNLAESLTVPIGPAVFGKRTVEHIQNTTPFGTSGSRLSGRRGASTQWRDLSGPIPDPATRLVFTTSVVVGFDKAE